MKSRPRPGTAATLTFTVEPGHAIDFAGAGMPAVLATPWLVWFMEHSAREAMLPHLEPGESTVGVQVDVEHLAATPVGGRVTCTARVIRSEGRLFSFQIEAADETEPVGRALHKLSVIDVERFARRVRHTADRKG